MTNTPAILGSDYDAPALLPSGLNGYASKRIVALARLRLAEQTGDTEVARVCNWELGLCDLLVSPRESHSHYIGGDYTGYALRYGLTSDTLPYAQARAHETRDIILQLHYQIYAHLQTLQTGREWVDRMRVLLETLRRYIDGCRAAPTNGHDFRGLYIEEGLAACVPMLSCRGVLQESDAKVWAKYVVDLAEESQAFPVEKPEVRPHMRYRWAFSYLDALCALPPEAADQTVRDRALALLGDAGAFYIADPLEDYFAMLVTAADAKLRKHWGELGTHERLIRQQYAILVRRAEFHEATGNGMLTAHFYREARRLVEQQRQYFEDQDIARLERAEQSAIRHAVNAGEFKEIRIPMLIPTEALNHVQDTAEATVAALVALAAGELPDLAAIGSQIDGVETPLLTLLPRAVVGPGKVVGESSGEATNRELAIQQQAILDARILGSAMTHTAAKGRARVGLTFEHLASPMVALHLDDESYKIILCGCERLLAEDWISAAHLLVLRIEDVLRQHLNGLGVDTTEFRRGASGTSARTDDASFATLMRKSLADGRTVEQYLGSDLWNLMNMVLDSQTGLNLRNDFAHGLARLGHCQPDLVGLALALLYALSDRASQSGEPRGEPPAP